jgi:hypothetical protein
MLATGIECYIIMFSAGWSRITLKIMDFW